MNSVTLIGNLCSDPELRQTPAGTAVVELRVAVDNGPDRPAGFFTVVAWGRTAMAVAQHQAQGRRIGVTGRLSYDEWIDNDQRRSRTYITAVRIDFLDRPATNDGQPAYAGEEGEQGS